MANARYHVLYTSVSKGIDYIPLKVSHFLLLRYAYLPGICKDCAMNDAVLLEFLILW